MEADTGDPCEDLFGNDVVDTLRGACDAAMQRRSLSRQRRLFSSCLSTRSKKLGPMMDEDRANQ